MGINFNEKDVVYFGMSQDRRDHSGYLKKKGFANPALKERYFVLKGNLLFYFKSPHVTYFFLSFYLFSSFPLSLELFNLICLGMIFRNQVLKVLFYWNYLWLHP